MAGDETPRPDELKFAQAMAELEAILSEIRDERIDVDDLAPKVDRAAQLIQTCRRKIDATEARVREIVAGLDAVAEPPPPPPAPPAPQGKTPEAPPAKKSAPAEKSAPAGGRRASASKKPAAAKPKAEPDEDGPPPDDAWDQGPPPPDAERPDDQQTLWANADDDDGLPF